MILIAGPSLKTCIEMALEAVCEKDGGGRRIFLFIYISSACAIIPQPSTLFLLLAFAFISSLGLTQTWLFPCIPQLFSYSTVSCVFSSVFFHLLSPPTFSLSSVSFFALILPSTYLSHFWILTSLFMFIIPFICVLVISFFPDFLSIWCPLICFILSDNYFC